MGVILDIDKHIKVSPRTLMKLLELMPKGLGFRGKVRSVSMQTIRQDDPPPGPGWGPRDRNEIVAVGITINLGHKSYLYFEVPYSKYQEVMDR